jgi:preprotein translocase subunit SecD
MRKKLITSIVGISVVAVGLLIINLSLNYRPALGLDLRGGISVTLRPVQGQDYDESSLDLAVERIRDRVDSFGVGEPEIIRQDNAIVVNLPGVNDQKQALDLVNVTGKVYLRPVIACGFVPTTTGTTTPESSTPAAGSDATATTTATDSAQPGPSRRVSSAPPTGGSSTTTGQESTTSAGDTATTTAGAADGTASSSSVLPYSDPTQSQVLPDRNGQQCQVGPSGGDGTVFSKDSAEARIIDGRWGVTVGLNGKGEGVWNAIAATCFNGESTCPSHQLAIELDGQIQSAPVVQAPKFTGNVQITGNFSHGEASKLAQVLNSGALPITLTSEQVENVSATLGKDSLQAAIVAGLIGVVLVVIFMFLYYRRLAVVVVGGLAISAALIYSVTALISRFYNGVLSLAGVAGIIVSIGVTIDSYVVFFERLKDEVRSGRSLRNSAQRGFKAAFHTILVADAVSLIGAVVLWYLSVGAVRGFAFYLGLATVTDIFVAYFWTRPAVLLLARSKFMAGDSVLGLHTEVKDGVQLSGATT